MISFYRSIIVIYIYMLVQSRRLANFKNNETARGPASGVSKNIVVNNTLKTKQTNSI